MKGWRAALGVAISVGLLWWTLRGESPSDIWAVLRTSDVKWFVATMVAATLSFPMRALRWRYILEPAAGRLPFQALWRGVAIGMMVNNVAFARAGEPARAWVLSRTAPVTFSAALASLVVDRLFDALVIMLLLLGVVLMPGFPEDATVGGISIERILILGSIVALVGLAGIAVVASFPDRISAIWQRVVGRVAPRVAERGLGIVQSFSSGLRVIRSARLTMIVFLLSLAQWLVNGASFWFAFKAVHLDASFSAALFLQSLIALAVAAPSAPGFFGVFEASAKVALAVYGVEDTFAVSYGLGYHILTFLPITLIGFWYLVRMGFHVRDFGKVPSDPPKP